MSLGDFLEYSTLEGFLYSIPLRIWCMLILDSDYQLLGKFSANNSSVNFPFPPRTALCIRQFSLLGWQKCFPSCVWLAPNATTPKINGGRHWALSSQLDFNQGGISDFTFRVFDYHPRHSANSREALIFILHVFRL